VKIQTVTPPTSQTPIHQTKNQTNTSKINNNYKQTKTHTSKPKHQQAVNKQQIKVYASNKSTLSAIYTKTKQQ